MTDDDLIPWLRSIWDTLERLALAVQKETGPEWPAGTELGGGAIYTDQAGYILTGPYESDLSWELRQYLAAVGPEQVLAEVDAKRRILDAALAERHRVVEDCWYTCPAATEAVEGEANCNDAAGTDCDCGRDYRIDRTARLLALPLADHSGYREEWRP